jgi:hypothetical protein
MLRRMKWSLICLALIGCDDVPVPQNFTDINNQVIQRTCAKFSTCHSPTGASAAGNMNLQVDPYNTLVNHDPNNAKALSLGMLRVDPGNVANSFMYTKLTLLVATDPMTDFGDPMPDKNERLPDPQLQGIRDWIARGAPND